MSFDVHGHGASKVHMGSHCGYCVSKLLGVGPLGGSGPYNQRATIGGFQRITYATPGGAGAGSPFFAALDGARRDEGVVWPIQALAKACASVKNQP